MAVNDFTAFDVIKSLQSRGIRPQDVAVTGFDNSEIGRLTTPPLTTARLLEGVGRPLVELLLTKSPGRLYPNRWYSRQRLCCANPAVVGSRDSAGGRNQHRNAMQPAV